MSKLNSFRRFRGPGLSLVFALALAFALGACQPGDKEESAPVEERKSPFATGNVSVAPQLEGRQAVPTPLPAPRPTQHTSDAP